MEVIERSPSANQQYAGFWLRFAAYIIDCAVLGVATMIVTVPTVVFIVLSALGLKEIGEASELLQAENLARLVLLIGIIALYLLVILIMRWLYYSLMETSRLQGTLGKVALGLRVTALDGSRVTFARATGRFFARLITELTFNVGYIIAGFTERKQALHDIIAGCLVVRDGN